METIENILKKAPKIGEKKSVARSERDEIIDNFLFELNRDIGKYRPYTFSRVQGLLSDAGLKKPSEMYEFFIQCKRANHFGKWFNWSLNPKNARK